MVMINRATKEITFKVVYYGPGLCGKTTNLEHIYASTHPDRKGKLLTVATETDRTLFFDFLPMELGTIRGMKVRVQLYTVPGQVFYDATRRIVLRGSDGVVFVADAQAVMMDANVESLENLKANLKLNSLDPDAIPLVFQYNKQDLQGLAQIDELEERLNWRGVPSFPSVAITGKGVNETLKKVIEQVIRKAQRQDARFAPARDEDERQGERAPARAMEPALPPPPQPPQPPPPPPQVTPAPAFREELPEVEIEEEGPHLAGEAEDDVEDVEIETLQEVEPLSFPPPAAVPHEAEPEPVMEEESGDAPQEEPAPLAAAGADAERARAAFANLGGALRTLALRVEALSQEVEAIRRSVEQAERDLLP